MEWLSMRVKLETLREGKLKMKSKLLNALHDGEQALLKSGALAASLILDPRYNFQKNHRLLNEEFKELGIVRKI